MARGRRAIPVEQRFWKRVVKTPGCWQWTGTKTRYGYGRLADTKMPDASVKSVLAHRVVFRFLGIQIPAEMEIDHLCRNKSCVNPGHLRFVTPTQNVLENSDSPAAKNARKTHCHRGHPFTVGNLYVYQNKRADGVRRPTRVCKKCDQIKYRRRKAKALKGEA